MKLSKLLQCQCVTRWHIVEMSRPQTLAEHQWAVAMIVAEFMEQFELSVARTGKAIALALVHDADEVDAGDIPSTAKKLPVPKEDFTERAVQIADKIEAAYFAKHYALGPRAKTTQQYTANVVRTLIGQLPTSQQAAWKHVMEEMDYE